jgi:hypothetical protein
VHVYLQGSPKMREVSRGALYTKSSVCGDPPALAVRAMRLCIRNRGILYHVDEDGQPLSRESTLLVSGDGCFDALELLCVVG